MTKEEFLSIDWNDTHVGYDIYLDGTIVAYITTSAKYPKCLCLVAGNKNFPVHPTGCGISHNPTPWDIIQVLEKDHLRGISQIIAVVDDKAYDLNAGKMFVNGIDGLVAFNMTEITKNITADEAEDKAFYEQNELITMREEEKGI